MTGSILMIELVVFQNKARERSSQRRKGMTLFDCVIDRQLFQHLIPSVMFTLPHGLNLCGCRLHRLWQRLNTHETGRIIPN